MTEFHRCDFCGREDKRCHLRTKNWMTMSWQGFTYEACLDCTHKILKHSKPGTEWNTVKTVGEE